MMENLPITIDAIPDGNDPFLLGVKWFGLVVAALLVGAAPVMIYLRKYHIDHVANSRDAASAEVYETLRQQIRDHGAQLHQYADDLAKQQSATFTLRAKLAEYEANDLMVQQIKGQMNETAAINVALKAKLDVKDKSMDLLQAENRQLVREILSLKDRVHELELRIVKHDATWCASCDRRGKPECTFFNVMPKAGCPEGRGK